MMKKVQRESGHDHETMEKRMHQETAQKRKTGREQCEKKSKLMLGSVFASFTRNEGKETVGSISLLHLLQSPASID